MLPGAKLFTEAKGCLTCEDRFCLGALHQTSQEEDLLSYVVQKHLVLDLPGGPVARNPSARDSMGSVPGLGGFHMMQACASLLKPLGSEPVLCNKKPLQREPRALQ